jgi:hypothetical protein
MKLLTSKIKRQLSAASRKGVLDSDPLVHCKFFLPASSWTWYVISGREWNHDDWLFFGFVVGYEAEFGEFSLSELRAIRGPLGLTVERDRYFTPCPLSEVMKRSSLAA